MRWSLLSLVLVALVTVGVFSVRRSRLESLSPKVLAPVDHLWLFEPGGTRIKFPATSPEAHAAKAWIDSHQSRWEFSSAAFSPAKTQLISEFYGVEFLGDDMLLDYVKRKTDDPDYSVHLKRALTPSERLFWQGLLESVKGLTSRQSQRGCLSRRLLTHPSRQATAWLTCNVSQKMHFSDFAEIVGGIALVLGVISAAVYLSTRSMASRLVSAVMRAGASIVAVAGATSIGMVLFTANPLNWRTDLPFWPLIFSNTPIAIAVALMIWVALRKIWRAGAKNG